jgi:hypothetical protein
MEIYQSPIYLNPTRGDGISQSSEVNRKYIKPSDYLQARLLLKDKPLTAHDIKASRVNLQTVEDLVIRGDVVILPQAGELTYYYPPKKKKNNYSNTSLDSDTKRYWNRKFYSCFV